MRADVEGGGGGGRVEAEGAAAGGGGGGRVEEEDCRGTGGGGREGETKCGPLVGGAGGGALDGGAVVGGLGTGGADLKVGADAGPGPLVFLSVGMPPAKSPASCGGAFAIGPEELCESVFACWGGLGAPEADFKPGGRGALAKAGPGRAPPPPALGEPGTRGALRSLV